MTFTANSSIDEVRDTVRENALRSFSFFASHVLCVRLSTEEGDAVQSAIESRRNFFLVSQTRGLLSALSIWLELQGFIVLCTAKRPSSEILEWLALVEGGMSGGEGGTSPAVSLVQAPNGVIVQWEARR